MEQTYLFRKTRIAPTPSGFLHLGNVLSFAITAALAQKTNARILLRIDDLDRERVKSEYIQDIFDTLNFLEIPWHEGPRDAHEFETTYSQLHRIEFYEKALRYLKENGHLFACTCSRTQVKKTIKEAGHSDPCINTLIPFNAKDANWRLKTDHKKELVIKTWPGRTIKTFLPASLTDFVVRKKDGYPAYQLASVLDDLYYDVDLIVRGEDLWPSTLAQYYLSSLLQRDNFCNATFFHHLLLKDSEDKKLSKTAGAVSIKYLRMQGKKPVEIYNQVGHMLGFEGTINNWQTLINHISALSSQHTASPVL